MLTRFIGIFGFGLMLQASLWCQDVTGPLVRFKTNQGDIDVELLPNAAPATVANFLRYVNKGAFRNSFVHRSVAGFIWQGGGYQFNNGTTSTIPQDAPVRNEYSVSNTRGTLAMAKLGDGPDPVNSATNQWFFNLGNNSANLNNQNGGFTVFGRVANSSSLAIMDKIAAIPVSSAFPSPFDQIPLVNYTGGALQEANLVLVTAIVQVDNAPPPAITGIISASGFGAFPIAAPGSFVEIYGNNLSGGAAREWAPSDFTNNGITAPTSLEGVTVTVDGQPAYVVYVSPNLVSAQIPANVFTGGNAFVVVRNNGQASGSANLTIRRVSGGLLAPASFKVADKQYVVAVHATTGAFVGNGTVPNVPSAPAIPGETLVFYGAGFGPVTPSTVPIAGQIVQSQSSLATAIQFRIGGMAAEVAYAGLAPGQIGVYQFNVTVPRNAPGGDQRLEVLLGGEPVAQTLFLPVQGAEQ